MARSGEGAGRMPLSAEMLEQLLPQWDAAPPRSAAEQVTSLTWPGYAGILLTRCVRPSTGPLKRPSLDDVRSASSRRPMTTSMDSAR